MTQITRRDFVRKSANLGTCAALSGAATATVSVGSEAAQIQTTAITGGAEKYGRMLEQLHQLITVRTRTHYLRFKKRRGNYYWLRDQVHVMKGLKYWDTDVASMLEFFLEQQTPEGMIWDHAMPLDHRKSRMDDFDKRWWQYPRGEGHFYMRFPVEADVEYLAVEGAYLVWQVTGDKAWMARWLPTLARALRYCMTDPLRWDPVHQLVKRPYTLDTWDFKHTEVKRGEPGRAKAVFGADETTPMGIMHGDNSGMYAACVQLAAMYEAANLPDEAAQWRQEADGIRRRTNALCWNGDYYKHFHVVDPVPDDYPPMDQERLLSMSNPYDINRGLATAEMASSIINTYQRLREKHRDEHLAEWYGIYPFVRPHFAQNLPGRYMNGGIITIVGGELAKAALQNGFESYGVDILDRLAQLMETHPKLPCTFTPDGKVDGGIPADWGQAAIVSAIVEGLAGVRDLGAALSHVEIAPRWAAADVGDAHVVVNTPMSGRTVSYQYSAEPDRRRIVMRVEGDAQRLSVRVLLPQGVTVRDVYVASKPVQWRTDTINSSSYVVFDINDRGQQSVQLNYG